jgi:hypothetical protein
MLLTALVLFQLLIVAVDATLNCGFILLRGCLEQFLSALFTGFVGSALRLSKKFVVPSASNRQ